MSDTVRGMTFLAGWHRRRFAARALRIASRTPGVVRAVYHPDRFGLAAYRAGEKEPVWIYLSNVYAESAGAPAAVKRDMLARLVRILLAPSPQDESWESVRAKLRPVLRPATFGRVGVPGMVPPLSRPAAPFLRELVVIDMPESIAYVSPESVQKWGVTVDEVFDAARRNLADIVARPAQGGGSGPSIVRMIDDGNGYFSSHLLSLDWFASMQTRMGAPVIAFVPDTNTVLVAPLADGVHGLYPLIEEEYREAQRSVSPVGYVAGQHGPVPYAPPPGSPDHPAAARAAAILAAAEYADQARWLSTQYREARIDVFVAALIVAAKPDEAPITVTTWTDGITSLLPGAQFIAFTRDGAADCRVPWEIVAERVPLEPEPLLTPHRYRVGGWPDESVMAELRRRAVTG